MPLFGPPNIERMANNGDVKGLAKVLHGEADPQRRAQAVNALFQIGDPFAAEALYDARQDDNPGVRAMIAIALAQLGVSAASELLIDTLYIGRETSVRLLAQVGGLEAVPPLLRVLEQCDRPDAMVVAAAEALSTLHDERAINPIIRAIYLSDDSGKPMLIKSLAAFGEAAVAHLVEQLTEGWAFLADDWSGTRQPLEGAFLALGAPAREALVAKLDQTASFDLLKAMVAILVKMEGGLDSGKAKAAYALVKGDKSLIANLGPEAQAMLTTHLRSKWGNALWLKSLVRIWGAGAVEQLINILDDTGFEYPVQIAALETLGGIGDEKAIPSMAAFLHSPLREEALTAIRKFDGPLAIRAVEGLLVLSESGKLRSEAVEALDQWNWTPGRDKVGAVYHITKGEWDRFMEIGDPVTSEVIDEILSLISAFMSPDQTNLIKLLEKIRDSRSTEKLIAALDHYKEEVRLAACHALGEIGDVRALEALEHAARYDSYLLADEPSNPWAYDHTGGSSDYWSSDSHEQYPVRDATRNAIEAIKQKA